MEKTLEKAERGTGERLIARVVTAGQISAKLREDAVAKLRSLVSDKLEVEFEVDPGLIGGMVVHLPDRVIDLSMAGRFRSYGRAVQELIGSQLAALDGWVKSEGSSGEAQGRPAGKE